MGPSGGSDPVEAPVCSHFELYWMEVLEKAPGLGRILEQIHIYLEQNVTLPAPRAHRPKGKGSRDNRWGGVRRPCEYVR